MIANGGTPLSRYKSCTSVALPPSRWGYFIQVTLTLPASVDKSHCAEAGGTKKCRNS
jgi:hypothetical protein